ncbi:MAG: TetR/AcrR family transcriptional regulator [Clostridia bacterium]|nr:TetR/AcrR family transcriptional regulator [Clostridia bacterium]
MILQGNEDLRVQKTIRGIKSAFADLICEKDYEKITVKELCDRARINKKTFYHYYETLDSLLAEMQRELSAGFLARIQGLELPRDLDRVNREFFLYSAEQDCAYEKITCSAAYRTIRDEMIAKNNAVTWSGSEEFDRLSDFEKHLLMDYINNGTLSAYRGWIESGKTIPLEEVIETTNRLQIGGVDRFFHPEDRTL